MSASWCAPCFSSIDFIDQLEEYWGEQNQNVKFVTALADIGEPYSCEQWGIQGTPGSPLIVEDDGRLFDWFHDSNGQYPSYVLIDHEMRVRAKPSNMLSNGNNNSCDGEGMEGDCLNTLITNLLDECGEGCSSGAGCSDDSACNSGDNTDCIYPAENHDCCGVCTAPVDCLGVCGGSATEEDCSESSNNCPTCTIVCPPDDFECVGDFTNIQDAIEFTAEGDTILVEQGIYYENLVIQKNITLASRAIFDDMSDWVGYSDEYFVNNENINGTILNGSADTNGEGFESVLLIESLDDCIEPLIFGFTITGGEGTIVMVERDDGEGGREEVEQIRGGGFLSVNALPSFKYNAIVNNKGIGDKKVDSGGGGDQTSGVDIPTHPDFNWDSPRTECDGELDLSFNFYKDNDATYGKTLSSVGFEGSIDMSSSIFDVYDCPDEEVTTAWVDVEDEVEVDFSYGVGDLCSITDDVWVSPDGYDNNLGTTESQAFLTISRALEMISPDENNVITIFLTGGTETEPDIFAPSTTGENFPILMISNVNLIGQGEEDTIIDAECNEENPCTVLLLEYCQNNIISGLTITGGFGLIANNEIISRGGGIRTEYSNYINIENVKIINNHSISGGGGIASTSYYNNSDHIASFFNVSVINNSASGYSGGGIYADNSSFENVVVTGNHAVGSGGGIFCGGSMGLFKNVIVKDNSCNGEGGGIYVMATNDTLENVIIRNNTSGWQGGGLYLDNVSSVLENLSISNNSSYNNGGVVVNWNYTEDVPIFSSEKRCNIYSNNSQNRGVGVDIFSASPIEVYLDTFSVMHPTNYHATPIENFSFDILNAVHNQVSEDLYVSLEGNNTNDGLTPSTALQSIQFALSSIITDSLITHTIYIANGIYSAATNGETFPISLPNNINLIGESEEGVILDADSTACVLKIHDVDQTTIANLTLTGGFHSMGGGMDIIWSNPIVENVTITGNSSPNGGGVYCWISDPIFKNVTVTGNTSMQSGGGFFINSSSHPILNNVVIRENYAGGDLNWYYGGGGIYSRADSLTLMNVIIEDNTAVNMGGGIYLSQTFALIDSTTVSGNSSHDGGGIYSAHSKTILNNVLITGNSAIYGGGGIYLEESAMHFDNGLIAGNSSSVGAGIYFDNTNNFDNFFPDYLSSITNLTISDNFATYAGGVYCYKSSPSFKNVLMIGNSGSNGISISDYSNPTLDNVTITAHEVGISISDYSNPIITNSIIWNNSVYWESIGDIGINIDYTSTPIIIHSVAEDFNNYSTEEVFWWEENGNNIETDPLFTDPVNGNYNLSWDNYPVDDSTKSPCIDAGTSYFEYEGEIIVDMPDSSYYGQAPDMGAFEWYPEDSEFELGDFNADGSINVLDVVALVENILSAGEYNPAGDLIEDGELNVLDIVALVNLILGGG